jgi:hypothetical protein
MGREELKCRHIYEVIGLPDCPDCGRPTHEIDWQLEQQIVKEWRVSGKAKEVLCPVEGGTLRGWWSI